MGLTYKRALGSRAYKNFTEENHRATVDAIKNRTLSYRNASLKFGIPKNTLLLKVKDRHTHNVDRQAVFRDDEEKLFVAHALTLSTFVNKLGSDPIGSDRIGPNRIGPDRIGKMK
ncbi:hypothetical protein WA026_013680 [Henosepilachna vigintioctopunctata]|uniref:HTH psq-type domain-containing protein n=1 Tax=Henosepilachna vigintioctopunctata TaxID=420089 RepID=A0AAW1V1R8_9CUCU